MVARILRRILVTLYIYIYKNLKESTTVCSLRSLHSLATLARSQLEKWFPLQGERTHSLKFLKTPISIQIKSKSNPNQIHSTSFILCFQGQPELCGSYHLHQSCFSFSVSMTNLSRLVAASFSSLALLSSSVSMTNLSCLLATIFSSLRLLSNSLSSPCFHLLRVGRRCYSWFSVFLFSRLILSILFLALSFSFLSERFFLSMLKLL